MLAGAIGVFLFNRKRLDKMVAYYSDYEEISRLIHRLKHKH